MTPALPQARNSTPKHQTIAAELAQSILDGQLGAGEKLPPHRVLAQRLGVTTGTVSRAYTTLEKQGLAVARVGDGTYVRNLDAALTDDPQTPVTKLIDLAHNVAIPTDEINALRTKHIGDNNTKHC